MADAKTTALTANTTPALTDIIYMVDDPSGTPLSQKITIQNLGIRIIHINVPLGAAYLTGAAIAAVSSHQVLTYRDANTDIADFSIAIPSGWGGQNLSVDAWWVAASSSGNIVTSVETLVLANGSALSSSATAVSATVAVTTNVVKQTYTIVALTEGQAMALRIYRSGSNGSDTLAASAYLCAVGIRLA